jgi:hypothetical protein
MGIFVYTQTDTVLGKLTNGRKLVMTEISSTDAVNQAATTITVKPLAHIIAYTIGLAIPSLFTFACVDGSATAPNTITITPSAPPNGATLQIIAVGE